ncbi:MAG TPA: alpha/beta hydrolase [Kofleriaceae bacterium]|nr:alpha/beta hydrolase [Kofleriaceae bacterium]
MRVGIRDTTLEVEQRGTGAPVIFVHGEFSDLRAWRPQVDALAPAFRTIAYSRRHYHPNPAPPPESWDNVADQHVDDLAALIGALGLPAASLVGLSSGGLIALRFAIQYPALVRRLVVCEPDATTLFTPYAPGPRDIVRLLVEHPLGGTSMLRGAARGIWPAQKLFARGDHAAGVETFMTGTIGARFFRRFSTERVHQMVDNAPTTAIYFARGAARSGLALAELEQLDRPTLVLYGDHSPCMHRMYAKTVHAHIAAARIAEIPDAAHFLNEHNPAVFASVVGRFLAERVEVPLAPIVARVVPQYGAP